MEKQEAWGHCLLRMKNGKGWSQTGKWTSIIDFTSQQMTLLDTEHKTIATLPVADLPDKMGALMPKMPEEAAKAMAAIKTSVDFKNTGGTDTILGIQAEEREMVLTMEIPVPGGAQSGMTMKMVMQIWTAKADEGLHNQAIRELMGYRLWTNYFMNPVRMMQKMMANLPGTSDAFKPMLEELSRTNAVMLRTRMAVHISLPPEAQKAMAAQNPGAGALDPNAPLFETIQDAVELSDSPVDASVFQLPADYQTIAADELLKTMMHSQMEAMGALQKP